MTTRKERETERHSLPCVRACVPLHHSPQVKASVYAVLDAAGAVRYIGVSRSVAQSLRLHLARMPEHTHAFKVYHIARPSRAMLEMTRQAWIQELGAAPEVRGLPVLVGCLPACPLACPLACLTDTCASQGNDGGPVQALWENALDVKPLMTPEDHAFLGP